MTRFCLASAIALFFIAPAAAQTPEQTRGTIAFVKKLQSSDGGFYPAVPKKNETMLPSLRATSSAIRTLGYLKSDVPDKDAVIKFVAACFDQEAGGFKDHPKGKVPDVSTTAVGIMAATELGMPLDVYKPAVIEFLTERPKSFEEIRIAAAAFESLKSKAPNGEGWLAQIDKLWNPDGTTGKEEGMARETGSLAVTVLRLGAKLPNEKAVVKAIVDGQQLNGGYGKTGSPVADLETCYRVTRAFHMLKQKPGDVEALRSFVLKCRNEDHGYGISPGEPSSVSATYFATIILYWLGKE